jgi:hypothetical protein
LNYSPLFKYLSKLKELMKFLPKLTLKNQSRILILRTTAAAAAAAAAAHSSS